MTIELYFSNQLDQLADKFADVLAQEVRNTDNPLEPPVVIVPNSNLAKWLRLFLAEKNSICMNIEIQYLENGLWGMLADIDPKTDKPELMDNDQLKIILLHLLQNLDRSVPDFSPLTRYLFGEGDAQRPDDAARLWQLSEKLAHLFKEYEFHRTDMVREWAASKPAAGGMERCQQRLYSRLKHIRQELGNRTGEQLLSTMEYADIVLSDSKVGRGSSKKTRKIHFFGLSQISNFHLTLIGRLQVHYGIHIYTLNPCEAFWEDIKTPREKRWIRRKSVNSLAIEEAEKEQGELFQQVDNALLAAWGKPGRENVRLLCQLTDYDFHACYTPAGENPGVLLRIQNDILTLSTADHGAERPGQDRSLQIIACPGKYREVETIYSSILFNMEQDDSLQLTDIAILVPDISAYKPVFDSVFNRYPRQLVYNLVDSHAEIESIYGKAVLSILKLAAGRFSRAEVFDLMLNPCFMYRWKIEPDDIQAWVNWTEALNIFHAFDSESRVGGGYPPGDSYTWKQGLERLRLSRIMAAPTAVDPTGFAHYRQRVPYSDVNSGDTGLVEKYCAVIETLHHQVKHLNQTRRGARQWRRVLIEVCDELIDIPPDRRGEAAVRQELMTALDRLELYDRLPENASRSALGVDLIREYINSNLEALSGGHGNYLTGGVTISALQPMRPIPFRIVYVLGMEEGHFPGKADQSSLDLRLLQRRIGDISLPERNCYLFLEMLLSVKEKLYISYIARDLQKDRIQQPCSVVNQLKRYVEQEILADGQAFQILDIPLAGTSDRYLDPTALNEWSDALVNYALADRVAFYRIRRLWDAFKHQASGEDLERIGRFEPDLSFEPEPAETGSRRPEMITVRQLQKYLEHPVRQKLRRHLGLYDDDETIEDVVLREDEPFYAEFPLDYRLIMEPIRRWLDSIFIAPDVNAGQSEIEAIYHRAYDACQRMSQTPEGAFAELDRQEIMDQVNQLVDTLQPVLAQMQSARELLRVVSIGDPAEDPMPSESPLEVMRFGPLQLSVPNLTGDPQIDRLPVEIHGRLPWLWRAADKVWHALVLTGSRKEPKEPDKYVLGPVLFYLMSLVGNESRQWMGSAGFTLHVVYRETIKGWTYRFDTATAAAYLEKLTANLLNPSIAAWLPFEVVTNRKRSVRPHKIPEEDLNDDLRMRFADDLKDAYDEEQDYLIRIARPPIPADALDKANRRFKLFFDLKDE